MVPWALLIGADARWLPSLDNNFVVQVDFEGTLPESDSSKEDIRIGDYSFGCALNEQTASPMSERYFNNARLRVFKNQCWRKDLNYWRSDVCFGKSITQTARGDGQKHYSLGTYVETTVEEPRSLREHYRNGTDGRTSSVVYKCGRWNPSGMVFDEPQPKVYEATVTAPSLCYEVERTPGMPFTDDIFRESPGAALLEVLWGDCVQMTKEWWTYEYCYPHRFRQYHINEDGSITDVYSLGTVFQDAPSQEEPFSKGDMVEVGPPISPKLEEPHITSIGVYSSRVNQTAHKVKLTTRISKEVVDESILQVLRPIPVRMGPRVDGYNGRGSFQVSLFNGTHCDETNDGRETTVTYVCAPNFANEHDTSSKQFIASVTETSVCKYDIVIETPVVCAHPRLLPVFSQHEERIISCARKSPKSE